MDESRNPEWEFVGIYTDESISGVNTKRREGFKRMVQDALEESRSISENALKNCRY